MLLLDCRVLPLLPRAACCSPVTRSLQGTVTLVVDIEFHPHDLLSSPLNLGSLPLIELDVGGLTGLHVNQVVAIRKGAAPPNMTYPEQAVSLGLSAETLADLVGGLRFSFENSTTAPFPPNASATVVREKLQELETIGEVEVFRKVHCPTTLYAPMLVHVVGLWAMQPAQG